MNLGVPRPGGWRADSDIRPRRHLTSPLATPQDTVNLLVPTNFTDPVPQDCTM